MPFDFEALKQDFIKNDCEYAYTFVESMCESEIYMKISYELIKNVYSHMVDALQPYKNMEEAYTAVNASPKKQIVFSDEDIQKASINIAGVNISDDLFLRKSVVEFIHFARISIDTLAQIINALFSNFEPYDVNINRILSKLSNKNNLVVLHKAIYSLSEHKTYKYICSFDNYEKHNRIVSLNISTVVFIGNGADDIFRIDSFMQKGTEYKAECVLPKIEEILNFVYEETEGVLAIIQDLLQVEKPRKSKSVENS